MEELGLQALHRRVAGIDVHRMLHVITVLIEQNARPDPSLARPDPSLARRNGRVVPYPKQPGARSRSPISSERIGPDPSGHTERLAVMHRVRPQKSAEAIVVFQCFRRVAEHEGPNLRSRAEQWVARYSTISRPA